MTFDLETPEVVRASSIEQWADEADVVVIGLGAAGACAAIEARRAGADVLVLERASGGGGSSAIAGGHLYLGGGTPVQVACGFEDSAEEMYKYLMALTPDPDPVKIRVYCDRSVAHFEWLEALGVPFERSFFPGKAAIQEGTECLIWTGNEKVWPFRERATPAPRGHKVSLAGIEAGSLLMKVLISAASGAGVRIRCDSRAVALIADDGGRVVGARFRHFGEHGDVRARRGVVLSAGGYIMNDRMFADQLAWMPRDLIKHGTNNDDGSGILLGVSAGAAPIGLDRAFLTSPFYPPEDMLKGILVNADGRRFVAEDSYHGRTAGFLLEQPGGVGYLILDSEIFGYPPYKFFEQELVDGFETVEEMEARLQLPTGSLVGTLEAYNRHARLGEDPQFHKYRDWLKPLDQPPYAAFDLSVGRAKFAGFSLGGLRTSVDAEVLTEAGMPIPGLYAAGACAWNIAQDSRGYSSGTCLGESTFFGRRAGRHAALSNRLHG
jgi:succinate dehydrogenase/fumarate reductase flavoprotein subunit